MTRRSRRRDRRGSRVARPQPKSSFTLIYASVMLMLLVMVLLFIRYHADKAASAVLSLAETPSAAQKLPLEDEIGKTDTGILPLEGDSLEVAQKYVDRSVLRAQDAVLKHLMESGR